MTFADLTDFLDDDGLPIKLGAHEYRIPSPDAETGIKLAAMANIGVKARVGADITEAQLKSIRFDDDEERDFIRLVLTEDIVQAMISNGVSWVALSRVAQYAFTHFAINPETARRALEAGMFSGKATAPTNRAARRSSGSTAAKKGQPASRGSSRAGARSTSGARSSGAGR